MIIFDNLRRDEAERKARKLLADDKKLRKLGGSGNYSKVEVVKTFEGPGYARYGVNVEKLNPSAILNKWIKAKAVRIHRGRLQIKR